MTRDQPSGAEAPGSWCGTTAKVLSVDGFRISETVYAPDREIPPQPGTLHHRRPHPAASARPRPAPAPCGHCDRRGHRLRHQLGARADQSPRSGSCRGSFGSSDTCPGPPTGR